MEAAGRAVRHFLATWHRQQHSYRGIAVIELLRVRTSYSCEFRCRRFRLVGGEKRAQCREVQRSFNRVGAIGAEFIGLELHRYRALSGVSTRNGATG